jgi:hypothetical protein
MISMSGMSTDVDLISDDVDLMSNDVGRCRTRSTCLNSQNNTTKSPHVEHVEGFLFLRARENREYIYREKGGGDAIQKMWKGNPLFIRHSDMADFVQFSHVGHVERFGNER